MLSERGQPTSGEIRAILDRFDVGGRLRYLRDFVWRGGSLQLEINDSLELDVAYVLTARWPAAVLERATERVRGMLSWDNPVVEGRWVRGTSGYELRIGIGLRAPTALYIRSSGLLTHVPFLARSSTHVESALQRELEIYVQWFISHCEPVPRVARLEEQRLRKLGLAA